MLKREDYSFRDMIESDLEMVLNWRNSNHVRVNMYNDHLITFKEHQNWFKRIKIDDSKILKLFLYKQKPIGFVAINDLDQKNNKAYFGFYLGELKTPPGIGALMEFFTLEYIFKELNIRKLYCEVFAFNDRVVKLHKRFGFEEEGYFKYHILKHDKYEDIVTLALFKEEWLEIRSEIEKIFFKN